MSEVEPMRYYRACALLLCAALLLSACALGPGPAAPESAPAGNTAAPAGATIAPVSATAAPAAPATPVGDATPVTITFGAWEYERQTYEPLIASFQKDNPN